MQHFPIFVSTADQSIIVSGGGEAALAKLRLLLKTQAQITVFAQNASADIHRLASDGVLALVRRDLDVGDVLGAVLFYAADEDAIIDARNAAIAKAEGALVNIVDNLQDSAFITPAIVDRDPVTVAIGTEGAAPVLARAIKAKLEEELPVTLGPLARIGKAFRNAADSLPFGAPRRAFWSEYYNKVGPRAIAQGEAAVQPALSSLLDQHLQAKAATGHVDFVGAGPGDPELLTLKARNALDKADVIIHDRLVSAEILELARREAILINVGKEGFSTSTSQDDINVEITEQALKGLHVVRLKGGDPTVFGRLDEEIEAVEAAHLSYAVIPGITAASAAVASLSQSLTKRGRNTGVRLMTAHDIKGFADQDWRALAQPGEVAALYMSKKAARFVQGRLLMHGAAADTPVTIVENVSRPDQTTLATTLAELEPTLSHAQLSGPAILLYGLAPRAAQAQIETLNHEVAL